MIILSGVLVVVAIALLVAGIVAGNGDSAQVLGLDALVVIYISIGVSIVSALCLALGVFIRRKELFGARAVPAAQPKKSKKDKGKKAGAPSPADRGKGGKEAVPATTTADDEVELPAQPVNVPDEALVHVVRGRKRYHLDTCRQLAGRDVEELTYAEAKEEGFSPCTACMPDTALAARAAVTVPAAAKNEAAPTVPHAPVGLSKGSEATTAELPATPPATRDDIPSVAPEESPAPAPAPPPSAWGAPRPADRTVTDLPAEPTEPLAAPEPEPEVHSAEAKLPEPAPAPLPLESDPGDTAGEGEDEGPQVRILSGTKRYHRTDCALIEDIGDEADDLEALSRAQAKARGCTPCLVCQPDSM
ncbi:hypothetical protein [Spirillospora sp. CA-294931]|uniref:hypothetical protein n=1 Tax=Spirillospora sp. CA-294931 TaxID=3240042 RepID=UPI003D91BA40